MAGRLNPGGPTRGLSVGYGIPEWAHPVIPMLTLSKPVGEGPGCFVSSDTSVLCNFSTLSGLQLPQKQLRLPNYKKSLKIHQGRLLLSYRRGKLRQEPCRLGQILPKKEQEGHARISVGVQPHRHIFLHSHLRLHIIF